MESDGHFQGVVCCSLDPNKTFEETIVQTLSLDSTSKYKCIECHNLKLENKYYKTTIHLFDYSKIENGNSDAKNDDLLGQCYAIILHANGKILTVDQLDEQIQKLTWVEGEPRVLFCDGIDSECPSYKTFQEWSIKNGYDFIIVDEEDSKKQITDSLSSYMWPHRTNVKRTFGDNQDLDDEVLKRLMDFDNLLEKMNAIKDRSELRGDPHDKKIEEIAQLLSNLLGEDADEFASNLDE